MAPKCDSKGCHSEAGWRPLVMVFLREAAPGHQSPLGLRLPLGFCRKCKSSVALDQLAYVADRNGLCGMDWVEALLRSLALPRLAMWSTRLEWEENDVRID